MLCRGCSCSAVRGQRAGKINGTSACASRPHMRPLAYVCARTGPYLHKPAPHTSPHPAQAHTTHRPIPPTGPYPAQTRTRTSPHPTQARTRTSPHPSQAHTPHRPIPCTGPYPTQAMAHNLRPAPQLRNLNLGCTTVMVPLPLVSIPRCSSQAL